MGARAGGAPALAAEAVRTLFLASALPRSLARQADGTATPVESRWLAETALSENAATRADFAKNVDLQERILALRRTFPTTMVMEEMATPRPAFLLLRGNYDAHGEAVTAGVPEQTIAPWPKDAPQNRLGLARWFTQPNHPLTGRVVVNRCLLYTSPSPRD